MEKISVHSKGKFKHISLCVGSNIVLLLHFFLFSTKLVQLAAVDDTGHKSYILVWKERDPLIKNLQLGGSVLCNSLFFSVTCQWFWTTGYFLRCLIFCKFLRISPAAADGSHPQQPQHAQNTYGVAAATVQLQAVQKQCLHQLHLHFSDMSLQLLGPQEQRFLHFLHICEYILLTLYWQEAFRARCRLEQMFLPASDYFSLYRPAVN